MKPTVISAALFASFLLAGCQNRHAQLERLQAEYATANKQYNADCIAPAYGAKGAEAYLKGTQPKVPTPQEEAAHNKRCDQELKQVTSLEQRIAALSR